MKLKTLFLLPLLFGNVAATANTHSPRHALEKLKKQENIHSGIIKNISKLELVNTVYSEETPVFYVYSDRVTQEGFVILCADDKMDDVLVGYSNTGRTELTKIPEALNILMKNCRIDGQPLYDVKESIAPMITTKWDQDAPYNDILPSYSDERCLAGCVCTAMSQLIRYHCYPQTPDGIVDYYWANAMRNFTLDLSEYSFDFDSMIDDYKMGSPTEDQIKAVNDLVYCCGASVQSNWGPSLTTAHEFSVPGSLMRYFNYTDNVGIVDRNNFLPVEWSDMLYSQLKKGLPVMLSAKQSNAEVGHAFICDGYDGNGYFHINWGWGGRYDGYFNISSLYTYDPDVDYSSEGFGTNQIACINIYPENKDMKPDVVWTTNDFRVSVESRKKIQIICRDLQKCGASNNIKFGVKLTKVDTGSIIYIDKGDDNYGDETYWEQNFPEEIEDGIYNVLPAIYIGETDKWQDVYTDFRDRNIQVSVTRETLTILDKPEAAMLQLSNPIFPEAIFPHMRFSVSADVVNVGQYDTAADIQLGICSKSANGKYYVESQGGEINVKVKAGETVSVVLTCENIYYGGEYYICLMQYYNYQWYPIGEPVHVPIVEYSPGMLLLDETSIDKFPTPSNPTLTINSTFHCEDGYYNGEIYMDLVECDEDGNLLNQGDNNLVPLQAKRYTNNTGNDAPNENNFSKLPKNPTVTVGRETRPIKITRQEKNSIQEYSPETPPATNPVHLYRVVYYYHNAAGGDELLALFSGMIIGAFLWDQFTDDIPQLPEQVDTREDFYNINGMKLSGNPVSPGIYIKKVQGKNSKTQKIIIH